MTGALDCVPAGTKLGASPAVIGAILLSQAIIGGWPSIARLELHAHCAIFITLRFGFASIILFLICLLKEGKVERPPGLSLFQLLFMGLITMGNCFFFLKAIMLLGAFIPSVAETMVPVVTLGLLAVFGLEQINRWKIAGICCAVTGSMVMVICEEYEAMQDAAANVDVTSWGFVFALGDIVVTASYIVYQKKIFQAQEENGGPPVSATQVVTFSKFVGCMWALLLAALTCPWTLDAWALNEGTVVSLFYATIGESVIVFLLLAWANQMSSSSIVAASSTLQPLFAAIFQFFILSEGLRMHDLVGGFFVILGLILTLWTKIGGEEDEVDPETKPLRMEA